jgi:hypothetical protein
MDIKYNNTQMDEKKKNKQRLSNDKNKKSWIDEDPLALFYRDLYKNKQTELEASLKMVALDIQLGGVMGEPGRFATYFKKMCLSTNEASIIMRLSLDGTFRHTVQSCISVEKFLFLQTYINMIFDLAWNYDLQFPPCITFEDITQKKIEVDMFERNEDAPTRLHYYIT